MSASFENRPPPVPSLEEQLRPPRTALAFALAPGIAALIGAVVVAIGATPHGGATSLGVAVIQTLNLAMAISFVGYLTMGIFAAPLYWVLPQEVRDNPAAVPCFAGAAAAAPWVLCTLLFGAAAMLCAAVAFAFGFVAGVAFVLIRGRPLPPPG